MVAMLFRQAVLFSALCVVNAQDFSVPSGWRKPTSNFSREDRANISQALIDTVVPLFNASSGYIDVLGHTQTANLLCGISLHDLISGNKSNEATVTDHLTTVGQLHPGYYSSPRLNTDPVNWALAVIYAYRAYGEQYLLDLASSLWNQTSQYMITTANAASGSHPLKNAPFLAACNGATIAGGVFYLVDNGLNTDVNVATVGGFMALSAHLFEATNDTRYAAAAELSAEFIRSHLYNGTIILDTITVANCATSEITVTYNSGFYIEGLSVWANVTNNSIWVNFLNGLISTTVPFPTWTGTDGINTEGPASPNDALTDDFGQALKAIFIRGLYEAWSRSGVDSAVANLIQSYILVQYNALLDLASVPNSNQYSSRWLGPPVDHLLPWGQLAALDVLNSALGMAPILSSAPSPSPVPSSPIGSIVPSPSPSTGSSPATSNTKTGLIAGVSVGGVGLLLILALIIGYLLLRRRRREHARRNSQFNPRPYHGEDGSIRQTISPPMSQTLQSSQLSSNIKTLRAHERLHSSRNGVSSATLIDPSPSGSNLSQVKHNMNISHAGSSCIIPSIPVESGEPQNQEAGFAATRDARDVLQAAPLQAAPLQSAQPTVDRRQAAENNIIDTDDPAMLPDLIRRMNRILARLPAREVTVEEEAPPRYES